MSLSTELFEQAQNYTRGRSALTDVDRWISGHLTEFVDLPDDDAGGMLWGFIQVRLYELRDGVLPEEEFRPEVAAYLAEHPLPKQRQRAAG